MGKWCTLQESLIEATYQRLSKEENVLSTKAMRGDEEAEEELDDAKARTKRALKDLI